MVTGVPMVTFASTPCLLLESRAIRNAVNTRAGRLHWHAIGYLATRKMTGRDDPEAEVNAGKQKGGQKQHGSPHKVG